MQKENQNQMPEYIPVINRNNGKFYWYKIEDLDTFEEKYKEDSWEDTDQKK